MTLRVSLVIDGNASGAKQAANETTQAISALARESGNADAAMAKQFANLQRMMSGSCASISSTRDALGQIATGNSATAVNARLGVWNDFGGGSRDNDIAAYGKQLDDLRAKYNPLFAAGQQYKGSLADINLAARVGAISEKERVDAIQRTKVAFTQQVGVIRNVSEASGGLSTQAMALSHSMRSAAEGIALGLSPTQIMAQQLNHLSYAASGQGGISGAFKEATGALLGFINPTTLVVGGLAAVAAGSYLAYSSIKQTEKEFGELSERTNTALQSLHALESAASFKGIDTSDFLKNMQQFGTLTNEAEHGLGSLATLFRANGVAAGALNDNLLRGADLIRNAGSEAEKYRLIQQLGLPPTREWVQYLSQGSDGLRQAAQGAVQFGGLADEHMIRKAREFDEAWDTGWKNFVTSGKQAVINVKGSLDELGRWANRQGQDMNPRMLGLRLSNAFADTGDYSNQSLKGALEKRAAQLRNGGSATVDPEEQQRQLSFEMQRIGVLGNLASIQETVRQSEIRVSQARLAGVNITAAEEARIRSYAEAQALGTLAIHQQADAQRIEANSVGLGIGATAAFRAEQERLADFRLRGIKLTQDQAAALHAEALALGEATQAAALRRLQSDIEFERSQIGRSSDDQQIASRLRGIYGDNYAANDNGAIAQGMRANQQLSFLHDNSLGLLKDFNSELRQGESLGKAFGDALFNALGKIEDKLLEMVFNNLFNKALGGNGGFNLLSLLGLGGGGDTGGGGGNYGGTGGGLGGFYEAGGFTGNLGTKQIAGVVHGKEFVINAPQTAKHRPLLEAINVGRFPGYAGGGYVGPPVMPAATGSGNSSSSGWGSDVRVYPPAGVETTVKKSRNANGREQVDIKQVLRTAVVETAAGGDLDSVNRSRYGLGRQLVNRA